MGHGITLQGKCVLLVEDEFMIAMDLEAGLEELGARVTCASRVRDASLFVASNRYDCAILDLNLHGETSLPIADLLIEKGVPFMFHTGHGVLENLQGRYPGTLVCNKPCSHDHLFRQLDTLVA